MRLHFTLLAEKVICGFGVVFSLLFTIVLDNSYSIFKIDGCFFVDYGGPQIGKIFHATFFPPVGYLAHVLLL